MSGNKNAVVVQLRKNGSRLFLKREELLLLEELSIHRIMHARDVHEFYLCALDKDRHPNTITNRLRRLLEAGILLRLKKDVSTNRAKFYSYYYKLGRKGLFVLVETGVISEKDAERLYKQILPVRIPKRHNEAVSMLANKIKVEGLKVQFTHFTHFRGAVDERLMRISENQNMNDAVIIPDWVFQGNHRSIFLEVDSGTQQTRIIESKVDRYIEYAASKDDDIIVVFSVIDKSVDSKISGVDRSKRISSLKETMPPIQNWPDNLSIYVVAAERTPDLILRLLMEFEPISLEIRHFMIKQWIEKWTKNTDDFRRITELEKAEVYGEKGIKALEADFFVVVDDGLRNRVIALLMGEEGSVKTYQRIRANHFRTKGTMHTGRSLDDLIIVYPESQFVMNDVYGKWWDHAWFTYRKVWDELTSPYPKMIKLLSPFRKEEVRFE